MSKYIDAKKLKAEIRKLRSESCISESDDYYEYAKCDIIDIIDSLQQEQPEVDLEKEILDWIGDEDSCKNGKWTWDECNKMIRHFYELGLKARKEE